MLVYLIGEKKPRKVPASFYMIEGNTVLAYNKDGEEKEFVDSFQLGRIITIDLEIKPCLNLCGE